MQQAFLAMNPKVIRCAALLIALVLGVLFCWDCFFTPSKFAAAPFPAGQATAYAAGPVEPTKPIHFAVGPADGVEKLNSPSKERWVGPFRFFYRNPGLELSDLHNLEIKPPLAVYWVSKISGRSIEVQPNGYFLYLVQANGTMSIAVNVQIDAAEKTIVQTQHGQDYAEGIVKGLQRLSDDSSVRAAGTHEARMLYGGGPLGWMAIWLKADQGGTDFVYPISPWTPSGMVGERIYTVREFGTTLRSVKTQADAQR
jgi:hypothetical protein